jgi:hypothetical protein
MFERLARASLGCREFGGVTIPKVSAKRKGWPTQRLAVEIHVRNV